MWDECLIPRQNESWMISQHWNKSIKPTNSVSYGCLSGCYKLHHANTLLLKLLTKIRFTPDYRQPDLLRYAPSWSAVLKNLVGLICISLGFISWQPVFTCNLKLFDHYQSYTCHGPMFVFACVHVSVEHFRECAIPISCVALSTMNLQHQIIARRIFWMFERTVKEFPVCS